MGGKAESRPLAPRGETKAPPDLLGPALETLGAVVRALAEFADPHEDSRSEPFKADAERWAQHVTIAAPAPVGEASADDASTGATEASVAADGYVRRDWEGLRRFVREHCRLRALQTATVVGDLRETLWLFIRNLHQAFADDGETDSDMRSRLTRLETLARGATTSDLKREVLETAQDLGVMIETRQRRHRTQMQVLGERVRNLGNELEVARRDGETDPLTALANRKAFDEYLGRTVEMCGAFGQPATLLLIDLDHFKSINDKEGHTTGDEALRQVANAVARVFLRKSDFCARYGGDELAVVLRETPVKEAEALADRLLRGVRAITIAGKSEIVKPTVSIGLGGYAAGDDARSWIDRADRGLYEAKRAGRNGAGTGS